MYIYINIYILIYIYIYIYELEWLCRYLQLEPRPLRTFVSYLPLCMLDLETWLIEVLKLFVIDIYICMHVYICIYILCTSLFLNINLALLSRTMLDKYAYP
jgi:hypothetical protein